MTQRQISRCWRCLTGPQPDRLDAMRYLLLPFFILRLFLAALPSLSLLLIIKLLPHRSLITTVLLLAMIIVAAKHHLRENIRLPLQNHLLSKKYLIQQQEYWETLRQKQPQHRDVLLNLSRISITLGNQEKAQECFYQAQQLDPNHQVFKTNN